MDLIHPLAEAYASECSTPEDAVLQRVAEITRQHPHAHMMSSQVQGKFLHFFSKSIKPLRILEVGSFTGYSGICLARGLAPGGILHTIELRDEDANTAWENFNLAGLQDKIILHRGNALDIIPSLQEKWDLVFIDADKPNYIAYYQLVLPGLQQGGVIIADNVLFHGQVLEDPVTGKNAKAILAFNEFVKNDDSVDQVMLTIRDGLFLIIKK